MLCGEEMRLVRAVRDEAMLVPGFEHHILSCPSCHDEERRLVFIDQPAPLSPPAESGEIDPDVLDARRRPAAPGAEHEAPKEITIVRSEKILPTESLPPAAPASSLLPKPRAARSAGSRVWDLKAELHRARWGLLCGRLGLRLPTRKPDTPTGS
jgi:hypothetical protein